MRKPPFGGYAISFKGCTVTLAEICGDKPMPPHEMTKRIWQHVREHQHEQREGAKPR